MTFFGRRLKEYVEFSKFFLILIPVIGITRLALSLSGTPNSTAKWISVSVAIWIGVFYYAVRVHTSGFGSYKQLLVVCVLMNLVGQVIIISGILLAIFTGTPNIFSAPEYAFGGDGATWLHAGAHLLIGTTIGSLVPWAVGSLVLFVARKMSPVSDRKLRSAV
jgi:hypothetical protein